MFLSSLKLTNQVRTSNNALLLASLWVRVGGVTTAPSLLFLLYFFVIEAEWRCKVPANFFLIQLRLLKIICGLLFVMPPEKWKF